jgi:hypothetical protein
MQPRRSCLGLLSGCFVKLILIGAAGIAFVYVFTIALNPWALHIGGRSTPLLWWHGSGTVHAKDGKTYPLYVSFWPGRPRRHSGGRREGKTWSANLDGNGYLCVAPGQIERMKLSGGMFGGYTTDANSLLSFRFLEWQKPFAINYQHRGFFDLAGNWHNQQLVMNRPIEQGIKLNTVPFIDNATATFNWSTYADFEAACGAATGAR